MQLRYAAFSSICQKTNNVKNVSFLNLILLNLKKMVQVTKLTKLFLKQPMLT